MTLPFPDLGDWFQTRDTLHAYARVLAAVRRQLTPPHPRWWHASLRVATEGLTTGQVAAPSEAAVGSFELCLNLERNLLTLDTSGQVSYEESLLDAPTAAQLGGQVLTWLRDLGIESGPDLSQWVDDGSRAYDPAAASRFHAAIIEIERVFEAVRSDLIGEKGPIQLWPHHFDLSFEWSGERRVEYEEDGETREAPAKIGFGFSTGDGSHPEAYFYANPWPFEESFEESPLPSGARWHSEGWQGGLLPYSDVRRGGPESLARFLRAVFEIAAPRLN